MTKDEHIAYWLETANHDLETAEQLFMVAKYDWGLFIGHLVLEKTLKALYVQNNDGQTPPKTHNLVRLAELSALTLTPEQKIFLDEVNDFNLEARYPDYNQQFYKICTKEFAEPYLNQIKEYYQWFKSLLTSETP